MKSILFAVFFLQFFNALTALDCGVADYDKSDCGYMGINQSQCESKGCCWASSSVSGTPWCFFSKGAAASSCYNYQAGLQEPFSSSEVTTMRNYFLANINIQGKGGVVAAPDYDTPGGSYYYHWMRDAALTMRCLQETSPGNFSSVEPIVKSYIGWVLNAQSVADPNGIDVRTEPKFMLPNGEVFSGAWCRPQNDGPGLRATTLMIAAQHLIDAGESAYVQQYLWTNNGNYHGGAIKYDLDYIVGNWNSNTCDLWEEIRDTDFFWNRITMKKAMIMGSKFAAQMGDSASAATYNSMINTLNANLYSSHWNGGYVQECGSRPQDSAVIVGFNDGFDEYDRMFAPTSIEVAKTVASYNSMFCNEYAINTADSAKGLPGVLYGRYKGDNYAGGNPWVLSTAALAGLFYRGASYIRANGVPSADALAVWQTAFNTDSLPSDAASLAKVFAQQGDGVMLRLRNHVAGDNFHLDEQIDRNTGVQLSAEDLTWSYAEVLNAMNWRNQYIQG